MICPIPLIQKFSNRTKNSIFLQKSYENKIFLLFFWALSKKIETNFNFGCCKEEMRIFYSNFEAFLKNSVWTNILFGQTKKSNLCIGQNKIPSGQFFCPMSIALYGIKEDGSKEKNKN